MNENKTNAPIKLPELLPCPFCGGPGYLCQIPSAAGGDRFIWIAKCSAEEGCGVEFLGCSRKVDAIKEWNTRNEADALRAEVEGREAEVQKAFELIFNAAESISEDSVRFQIKSLAETAMLAPATREVIKAMDAETSGEGTGPVCGLCGHPKEKHFHRGEPSVCCLKCTGLMFTAKADKG